MVLIARKSGDISKEKLLFVYNGTLYGSKAEDFWEYISRDFFAVSGSVYCIWEENGEYRSALRVEPYQDGMLLTGLETAPLYRRNGYAKRLLREVISYLKDNNCARLYSHVQKRNIPSQRFHSKMGFEEVLNYAHFTDGTISADANTLILNIE